MKCPKPSCDYYWLKLPGIKMRTCANCGGPLVATRKKKRKR